MSSPRSMPHAAQAALLAVLIFGGAVVLTAATATGLAPLNWRVVVNNSMAVPGDSRHFNSYNPPSVNVDGLVVFRARTRGGVTGEPAHGVFMRPAGTGTDITTIFDRNTAVPFPNNLGTAFVEPPSFPRIDMWTETVASRGNHPPAWEYLLPDGTDTRAGTTGIYVNPFSSLLTGASNLGAAPGFELFAVPGTNPPVKFDVFPGAPAVARAATIVFKGNYTVPNPANPAMTISRTGVYYRDLTADQAGGIQPVVTIADGDTTIPGSSARFGSVAPPSAAGGFAVFTGWDNEWMPTVGGIYMAPLTGLSPSLTTLVRIGERVPGERPGIEFRNLGEGLSFDGRFVAFWGTWGSETRTLVLQCPEDGNRDRVAYCHATYPAGFTVTVPVHQGIFVHDTATGKTSIVAKTPEDFTDFIYWNFSGMVPGSSGHSGDAGEPARWRAASFVAVSGLADGLHSDATFHVAFKARMGTTIAGEWIDPVDGVYLRRGPGVSSWSTLASTGADGRLIDPAAVDSLTGEPLPITDVAIERDGFRGRWLAIGVSMGTEEAGWAGIYLTEILEQQP